MNDEPKPAASAHDLDAELRRRLRALFDLAHDSEALGRLLAAVRERAGEDAEEAVLLAFGTVRLIADLQAALAAAAAEMEGAPRRALGRTLAACADFARVTRPDGFEGTDLPLMAGLAAVNDADRGIRPPLFEPEPANSAATPTLRDGVRCVAALAHRVLVERMQAEGEARGERRPKRWWHRRAAERIGALLARHGLLDNRTREDPARAVQSWSDNLARPTVSKTPAAAAFREAVEHLQQAGLGPIPSEGVLEALDGVLARLRAAQS